MNTKKKHCVYKYVLRGEIIYIGLADIDLDNRIRCHGKPGDNIDQQYWNEINKAEIYYMVLANSVMADIVEKELIRRYKPKCNKAYTEKAWSGLPFEEPEWTPYVKPKKEPDPDLRYLKALEEAEDLDRENQWALDKLLYYRKKLQKHPWAETWKIFVCDNPDNKPLDREQYLSALPSVTWDKRDGGFGTHTCPGCLETRDGKTYVVFSNVKAALQEFEEMIEIIQKQHEIRKEIDKRFYNGREPEYQLPFRYKGILW